MSVHFENSEMEIIKIPHMGMLDNNGYILTCRRTGEKVIIDAPDESEKLADAAGDGPIKAIIITHRHADHTAGLRRLKERTGAPVAAHPDDAPALPMTPDILLQDGDSMAVGDLSLQAMHTPGHTPGALCLVIGNHVFSGDTLFKGGPGRTGSPDNFRQVKASIEEKLLPLEDGTAVYTGHGPDTLMGDARREIAQFNSRTHPDDLCGDVEWLKS